MEKTHFKIRNDILFPYNSCMNGIVYYNIYSPEGFRIGHITNWVENEKTVGFADRSNYNTYLDLPF